MNATKERQAWCCLQVKLCDPCLSALCVPWCKKALYKYSSFPFISFYMYTRSDGCNGSRSSISRRLQYSVYFAPITSRITARKPALGRRELHASSGRTCILIYWRPEHHRVTNGNHAPRRGEHVSAYLLAARVSWLVDPRPPLNAYRHCSKPSLMALV